MHKDYLLIKSGTRSSWIIKDTQKERMEDMRNDFKSANLYYTPPYNYINLKNLLT